MAQEVIAMGTNRDTLHLLGVKTPEDAANYAKLYSHVADALLQEHGEDVMKVVESYQDPKVRELIKQVQENGKRIGQDKLQGAEGRLGVSEGKRTGSPTEKGGGTLAISAKEWEGSGRKSTRYQTGTQIPSPELGGQNTQPE
jgi:hypothetical protein